MSETTTATPTLTELKPGVRYLVDSHPTYGSGMEAPDLAGKEVELSSYSNGQPDDAGDVRVQFPGGGATRHRWIAIKHLTEIKPEGEAATAPTLTELKPGVDYLVAPNPTFARGETLTHLKGGETVRHLSGFNTRPDSDGDVRVVWTNAEGNVKHSWVAIKHLTEVVPTQPESVESEFPFEVVVPGSSGFAVGTRVRETGIENGSATLVTTRPASESVGEADWQIGVTAWVATSNGLRPVGSAPAPVDATPAPAPVEPTETLDEFKARVYKEAMAAANEHGWCSEVQRVLRKLGIEPPEVTAEFEVTIKVLVRATAATQTTRDRIGERDESFVRDSVMLSGGDTIGLSMDSDWKNAEVLSYEVYDVDDIRTV